MMQLEMDTKEMIQKSNRITSHVYISLFKTKEEITSRRVKIKRYEKPD